MSRDSHELDPLKGTLVVVDTATPYLYIGTLKAWTDHFIVLADADVHDVSEGGSTKEMYALESARNNVQKNRREVIVRMDCVVSISRLSDVIVY